MPLRGDSDMIEQFREEYSFLSNFYPAVLTFEGKTYLNSEAAYQAAKCVDESEKEQSYRNSLDLAKQHRIGSIAFPAISTGKYSYPKKEAVEITVKTVLAWQAENSDYVMDVAFITTDLGIYRLFCEQFD